MDKTYNYIIMRSDRKTIGIQIMPDGSVVVRCPKRMRQDDIKRFVESKTDWIEKHLAGRDLAAPEKLTEQEVKLLREKTRKLVTERVKHYAAIIGVQYNQITIRTQRTRWGSCSSKGNLNFNFLLGLTPPEVLDYVVVHALQEGISKCPICHPIKDFFYIHDMYLRNVFLDTTVSDK